MTDPKVNTIHRGGSRFYVDPETGRKNPGVTSILNMLPKPFLKAWAAKLVAETAVNNITEVIGLAFRDPQGAIDYLKRAPDRFTKSAADNGSEVHDVFEQIAKGTPPKRVHPDIEPYVAHFMEFLDLCEPEFLLLEETVWSDEHGYAGSFDALAILHGAGAGELQGKTLFMDWKTTRSGVHEEVALQLAGYQYADAVVRPDGARVPLPEADGGAVLHVRPEGWQLVPVNTGIVQIAEAEVDVYDYLLALREVFDWDYEVKKHVLGRPVAAGGEFSTTRKKQHINKPKPRGGAAS